ncbi:MAG: DUF1295 domain-containing protein [Magnetococcus sp. DMHC-6]
MRWFYLIFGLIAYLFFNTIFIYMAGFLTNFMVPKSMDVPLSNLTLAQAFWTDVTLMLLFALHHSVAPRPFFKRWLARLLPSHLERSVYVLMAALLLGMVLWHWQPLPMPIWRVEQGGVVYLIHGVFIVGIITSLVAMFQTDHYELFGLRQILLYWKNQPYFPPPFNEKGLYKWVRHPMMLGTLLVLWATPHMTAGHLLFSVFLSCYIFIGIFFEERDLEATLGALYVDYRQRVPMVIPFIKRSH